VTTTRENSGAFNAGRGGGQPATPEALQQQVKVYKQLFEIFARHKAVERVTLWGLNDNRTWRRGTQPLLFDGQLKPKAAFQAVIDVGLGKTTPEQP